MYYLIDLERSVGSGITTYWKPSKRGYSTNLEEAGIYSEELASEIVKTDFDKRTVMISKKEVERILHF